MDGYAFTIEQKVTWRDLDALGHVNNAVYATYLETARMEYMASLSDAGGTFFQLILAELTLTFKSPAMLAERLVIGVRVTEVRNSSFLTESQIEEKESGRLILTSRAVLVHFDYQAQRSRTIPAQWRAAFSRVEGRPF